MKNKFESAGQNGEGDEEPQERNSSPETDKSRKFIDVNGHEIIITEQTDYGRISVGDTLILKKEMTGKSWQDLSSSIQTAKELRVVGVVESGKYKNIVIQLDGDKVFVAVLADVYDYFEDVGPFNPKKFIDISGNEIVTTGERMREGISVGPIDCLKPKHQLPKFVRDSKELRLVGFTQEGKLVIRNDKGEVVVGDKDTYGHGPLTFKA